MVKVVATTVIAVAVFLSSLVGCGDTTQVVASTPEPEPSVEATPETVAVDTTPTPEPTPTPESDQTNDCGEDEYEGWTGECCPTDSSNSNCGVSPCHSIGGSPDWEYDENGECVEKEPLPDPEPQQLPGLQDVTACKLMKTNLGPLSLAYDRPFHRLPSTGPVEAVVLFADFADVSAIESTEDVFSIISPGAENFFLDQSYARLSLSFRPYHEWLQLSGTAAKYGEALTSYTGHRDWIQEAMNLADAHVDFTGVDAVLVVSPPNASGVPYGPTLMGWSDSNDGSLVADGTYIANAVTSGTDLTYWGDLWYPHEMGHSLGLPDLYGASIPGRGGFTRPFSLMDDIGSEAPGYMGYSRWILRWLDDDQVACMNETATVSLTPLATTGGLKLALIPFSPTKALAIESRKQIGYDSELEREGVVTYLVNTENGFGGTYGEGPMEVLNDAQTLLLGESVTYENVTVTVEETSDQGDVIHVQVN